MSHVPLLKALYAAMERGDSAALLEAVDADVVWEHGTESSKLPWVPYRQGRADVVAGLRLTDPATMVRFEPLAFLESGADVTARVGVAVARPVTAPATASVAAPAIEWREVHQWRFDAGGRIVRLRQRSERGDSDTRRGTLLSFGPRGR